MIKPIPPKNICALDLSLRLYCYPEEIEDFKFIFNKEYDLLRDHLQTKLEKLRHRNAVIILNT